MPEAPRQLTLGQRPTPMREKESRALSKPPGAGKPTAVQVCVCYQHESFPAEKKKSEGRKEKSHQLAPARKVGVPELNRLRELRTLSWWLSLIPPFPLVPPANPDAPGCARCSEALRWLQRLAKGTTFTPGFR